MLVIRKEQLDALAADIHMRLIRQLASDVRSQFPTEAGRLDDDALLAFITSEVAVAESVGLYSYPSLRAYVFHAMAKQRDSAPPPPLGLELHND